ncbi:hypothetical protein [Chryseobacterium sp. JV558]|uniref:hypothetical protein n=1 Tax=Chryseobacterium sp. JV558 TaxID=2663236 RepID=UPI00299F0812|nr:hypothetical protein [Chryseobacterium sp. JV558]MDW9382923.1 hypothetical protein [Chryseobacterium sp. JV558]
MKATSIIQKRKLDSVNTIKHDIIRQEWIKKGVSPSAITKEALQNAESNRQYYLQYAYFTMNRKGYSFYYSDDQKMILSENKDLVIEYSFTKDTYSEYLHNKKIATANQYFSSNGQLKRTDSFILPLQEGAEQEITGISKEYNVIGKLLFEADWEKEFKHNKAQVIAASDQLILQYIPNMIKRNSDRINDIQAKEMTANYLKYAQKTAQKFKNDDKIPMWIVTYWVVSSGIEMKINDKTLQLINIRDFKMQE